MQLSDFDYFLPSELIAQRPIQPRDHSRLMVLNRQNQTIVHDYFYNLGKYLRPGDILVANNSKVIPARLVGKKTTGGQAEIFLLKQINDDRWQVLIKNCHVGDRIFFQKYNFFNNYKLSVKIVGENPNRTWEAVFSLKGYKLMSALNHLGQTPVPPYIKRSSNLKEYQTVYAKLVGSVAAPTAGFHFTPHLMQKIQEQGVKFFYLTLHVGLGTFLPVTTEKIEEHQLHAEWAEISTEMVTKVNQAKKNRQRVIAIGTTSVRALEYFSHQGQLMVGAKWINLFIYPGYQFQFVDVMVTNFHLPKSSLLMLVSAFGGHEFIKRAYQEAIRERYRFYSFGDAMLII